MTPTEKSRVACLRADPSCLPRELVLDYYGLKIDGELAFIYNKWKSTIKGADRCVSGTDRILLELFFHEYRWLPHKWMAARLGMTERSLRQVLEKKDVGSLPVQYEYLEIATEIDRP